MRRLEKKLNSLLNGLLLLSLLILWCGYSMFKSIWLKVSAGLAAVAGFLFMLLKIERHKRKEAETKAEIAEKSEEITEYMAEVKESEQVREQREIERKAQEVRNAGNIVDINDRINGL